MKRRVPRIGLALGGGGIAGFSFHAGALGALQEATGWDPRTADVIIGTSAGSSITALLRGNVSVGEQVAWALSIPTDPVSMARLREVAGRGQPLLGTWWLGPSAPSMVVRELFRFHRIRPLNVVAGMLPAGRIATSVVGDQVRALHGDDWPAQTTWIPAIALDSGELTVFGRDPIPASLSSAVQASCSIPAFYEPVLINGRRYVDGGVRSMLNADLLADEELDLDLVVALSPLSIDGCYASAPFSTMIRGIPKLQLRREISALADAGIPTLSLEPDPSVSRAMGRNPMDPTRVVSTLTAAAASAANELEKKTHKPMLDILREAGRSLTPPADVPFPD